MPGAESEPQTDREFEVTVRRGNDDRLDVLTISAESAEAAEREAMSEPDVHKVRSDCTVEFNRDDDGSRVYGNTEADA